jgi:hypothetical protein
VAEGIHGFNIVRLPDPRDGDVYYGIRQNDGPFYYDKIIKCTYSKFFEGVSMDEVKKQIENFAQGAI